MSVLRRMVPQNTDRNVVVSLIATVWLLQLCALLLPDGRIWGINALRFLPDWFRIAYLSIGMLVVAMLFNPL